MKNHYILWTDSGSVFVTDIRTRQEIAEYIIEDDVYPDRARIKNEKLIIWDDKGKVVFDYPY
jgi:hypothetical protein